MIQKMKLIFAVVIIINFESGESLCQPKGRPLAVQRDPILKNSVATKDGYVFEWVGGLDRDLWGCFDEVSLYYNGRPDTKCCYGYQNVSKYPKKGEFEPFIIPDLCGKNRKELLHKVFFKPRIGKQALEMFLYRKTLKLGPCKKVEEEEEKRSISIMMIPFIICGVLLILIFFVCGYIYRLKKKRNIKDIESTERNYEDCEDNYEESEDKDKDTEDNDKEYEDIDKESNDNDKESNDNDEESEELGNSKRPRRSRKSQKSRKKSRL